MNEKSKYILTSINIIFCLENKNILFVCIYFTFLSAFLNSVNRYESMYFTFAKTKAVG